MNYQYNLLDIVALQQEIPQKKLFRGQVGTIVELLDENVFLVEFSDFQGKVYALEELTENEILKLYYEPEHSFS